MSSPMGPQVTKQDLLERLDETIAAANADDGPVAILQDGAPVAYLLGCADMDSLRDLAIAEMLRLREKEPTVSHEDVIARTDAIIAAAKKRRAKRA